MSFYRGQTINGNRLCACGCGELARRMVYNGRFKAWRQYATGHAPAQRVIIAPPSSVADLAYAAGIIDGEGCIYARVYDSKSGVATLLQLQVSMCSEQVVRWFAETFGGDVYTARYASLKLREIFIWQVRGKNVAVVLSALLPYLKEKAKRARLAIELADCIQPQGYYGRRTRISSEERQNREHLASAIKSYNNAPRSEDSEATIQ